MVRQYRHYKHSHELSTLFFFPLQVSNIIHVQGPFIALLSDKLCMSFMSRDNDMAERQPSEKTAGFIAGAYVSVLQGY